MAKKVHFIGIGGIGMSALAQWYANAGFSVQGSDAAASIITDDLAKRRIEIFITNNASRFIDKSVDLVIFTSAVPELYPERIKAGKLKIPQKSYAQALGELTGQMKTLAVCGTHGKSTTTAMLAMILMQAKFDPTVIVGTRLPQFDNNNFRYGKSQWLVIEADEYKAAFLNHKPHAIICTNVEPDHLDHYQNYANVKKAFKKFFNKLAKNGFLILNAADGFLNRVKVRPDLRVDFFNIEGKRAKEIRPLLKVPGRYNLANALAADKLAERLGIKKDIRNKALAKFKGTWRRFEYKGQFQGARVYDDYAHHPTELKAVLEGTREAFANHRIICVHQPHLTSRLESLFEEFTRAFGDADSVIILDTYKVRGREQEKINFSKSAESLARRVSETKPSAYAKTQKDLIKLLRKEVKKDDIVLITGAGSITEVANYLVKK